MHQDHKGLNPNGSQSIIQSINQRDEVPTALLLKIKHWDVVTLNWYCSYHNYGGVCSLHRQGSPRSVLCITIQVQSVWVVSELEGILKWPTKNICACTIIHKTTRKPAYLRLCLFPTKCWWYVHLIKFYGNGIFVSHNIHIIFYFDCISVLLQNYR